MGRERPQVGRARLREARLRQLVRSGTPFPPTALIFLSFLGDAHCALRRVRAVFM